MQFTWSEIHLMLDENRQEAKQATPCPPADRTATTRGDEHRLAELRAILAAQMLEDPFGDLVLDEAQEEVRPQSAAAMKEQFRIRRAWEAKCESIAVRKTRLRVNDSDWATYRDQLSRRRRREGRDDGRGQRNRAKQPALWSPFEDEPKVARSQRRRTARPPVVNPFD
jgi:hypothetical protein